MFCDECGAQLEPDASFCDQCGVPIVAGEERVLENAAVSTASVGALPRSSDACPQRTVPEPAGHFVSGTVHERGDEPPTIDGWGSEGLGIAVPPVGAPPGGQTPVAAVATRRLADEREPLPTTLILWETLDVIREWPAKVIHNPTNLSLDAVRTAVLDQLEARGYLFKPQLVELHAELRENAHLQRTSFALSPSRPDHLTEVYLLIQVEQEGADVLLGLSLLRVNGLKHFCNRHVAKITGYLYGTGSSFNWSREGEVSEFIENIITGTASQVLHLPRESVISAFSVADLFEKRDALMAEIKRLEKEQKAQQDARAQAQKELQNRLALVDSERVAAGDRLRRAERTREKAPKTTGWLVFASLTVCSILFQTGGLLGLAILLGPLASLVARGITAADKTSASAALNEVGRNRDAIVADWQQEEARFAAEAQETSHELSLLQRKLSEVERDAKKQAEDTLRRLAQEPLEEEQRWFGRRGTDPALDRFVQVCLNLVNEVQAGLFPTAPPFKLLEYG